MCKWVKSGANRVDPCMRAEIRFLQSQGVKTLACCCGHGRYPETIIVKKAGGIFEFHSDVRILRRKRFYVRDKDGFYYIPEVVDAANGLLGLGRGG